MTENRADQLQPADTGLGSLVLVARLAGVASDAGQLKHQFGESGQPFDEDTILRAAKFLGLRARSFRSTWERLQKSPMPAIAQVKNDRFIVVGRIADDALLIQDPTESQPRKLTRGQFEELWTGRLILVTKRSILPGMSGKFDFSWFIPSILKYKRLLGQVLIASFFIQLLALVTPLFFQVVIDKVLVHRGLTTLDVLAIGLIAVSLFEVVLTGLRTYLFSHTTNRVDVELGAKLYSHLQGLPVAFFSARPIGSIVARVRELDSIRNFITGSTLTVVIDLFFTFVFFFVMYLYSSTLFWVVVAAIPFYVVLSALVTPILRRRLEEQFNRGAINQSFLVESVGGVETVKSMAIEPQMQRRWEDQLAAYVSASFKAANLGNIASQSASFINKITTVLILWVGARLVITGQISVGQLVAFNMLAGRVSGPILRLVQLWQELQQAGISMEKLADILDVPREPGHNPNKPALPAIEGRVNIENVTFRYAPDRPEVLSQVSVSVQAGEIIGIVGRSGSGKSTLSKLIQRLYVPNSGRVLIDGVDVAMVDPTWLRRQVGVVLQENFLFNCSVRDNIALADKGMPIEPIVEAAKLAGAHEFILELPEGYDTVIEEQGRNLSGGQRQRLAIARALVTDPRILIFDEATSALDYESERVIQHNMRAICANRTVFIIAHRLSAIREAGRILVLDGGRLVEEGSHASLLERKGHYAALFAQQVA